MFRRKRPYAVALLIGRRALHKQNLIDEIALEKGRRQSRPALEQQAQNSHLIHRVQRRTDEIAAIGMTLSLPHRGRVRVGAMSMRFTSCPPPNLPPTGGGKIDTLIFHNLRAMLFKRGNFFS